MFKDSDMELILPGPAAASAYTHPTPEQDRRRRVFEHGQVRDAFAARPDGAHILFLCKTLFRMHSLSAELQSMILSHMPLGNADGAASSCGGDDRRRREQTPLPDRPQRRLFN